MADEIGYRLSKEDYVRPSQYESAFVRLEGLAMIREASVTPVHLMA